MKRFLEQYGIWILLGSSFLLGLFLLYFRNATLDDDLYLRETMIMSEVLRGGEWIGNYAVGIHGFLFKLPVALFFLITGPSLVIATIWNILLGVASLYLFYGILQKIFKSSMLSLGATFLLFTNFQFILNYPTYMREIPALFCILLVVYLIVFRKSRWLLGLALFLLLDAKEYVMLIVSPGILLYIFFAEWVGFRIESFKKIFYESFKTFFPSLILFLLMLFTTIIPLNTFLLSVFPLTDSGVEYHIQHFDTDMATRNLSGEGERESRILDLEEEHRDGVLLVFFKSIVLYFGKFLYPYSFSFLSIPEVIFFPALFASVFLISEFRKKKRFDLMSLSFMLFFYLLVFILRSSFTRYLFPILPIVLIFFTFFIQDFVKNSKKYFGVLVFTFLMVVLGLFFDEDYILIKLLLNLVIFALFIIYYYYKNIFKYILILAISIISFSTVMYFFYSRGQIHQYLMWGRDYEVQKVVGHFDKGENILLNDPGWDLLPQVYRYDTDLNPEFRWELKEWIPRKKYLKNLGNANTYKLIFINEERFFNTVQSHNVSRIGLITSNVKEVTFPYEEKVDLFKEFDWLKLEDVVEMKNKTLFIFRVID